MRPGIAPCRFQPLPEFADLLIGLVRATIELEIQNAGVALDFEPVILFQMAQVGRHRGELQSNQSLLRLERSRRKVRPRLDCAILLLQRHGFKIDGSCAIRTTEGPAGTIHVGDQVKAAQNLRTRQGVRAHVLGPSLAARIEWAYAFECV